MSQHFLLSRAAKTLTLAQAMRMSKPEKVDAFTADIVSVLQQKTAKERRSEEPNAFTGA